MTSKLEQQEKLQAIEPEEIAIATKQKSYMILIEKS